MSLTRTCDVCGKSIPVAHDQPVYRSADGVGYVHRQCFGKASGKRTETIRGENWGGASPFNLIPNRVRIR
jgi:hypothetical protein